MKLYFKNLHELLTFQLRKLKYTEKQLAVAIPGLFNKVTCRALRKEMVQYNEYVIGGLNKLETILETRNATEQPDEVMHELILRVAEARDSEAPPFVRDAAIISCLQNINHYKIAGYGTAMAMAKELNLTQLADPLCEILYYEKATNRALSGMALGEINKKAVAG